MAPMRRSRNPTRSVGGSASRLGRRPAPVTHTMMRRSGLWLPVAALAIAVLLPLAVLFGSAFLMGMRFQPLESGSMEPRFPLGSLALVAPIDAADVEAGMAIVFTDPLDPTRLIAHRAVKQLPGDPPAWQTKGDANVDVDSLPVHAGMVRGRV